VIRPATPADLDAVMAIETASFPTDAWTAESMSAELAYPHSYYVVDEADGEIVGYAGLRSLPGSPDGDVQTIALAASARGRGRGRALLRALVAEADARRVREVFLEVRADNPVAQRLYESEGFEEIGRRPHYYQPDDVAAVVMRIDVPTWRGRQGAGSSGAAVPTAGEGRG